MHVTVSNFVKIGRTDAEILRFYGFPRWRLPPSWIIKKFKFLPADRLERQSLHNSAKFHQDQPIR